MWTQLKEYQQRASNNNGHPGPEEPVATATQSHSSTVSIGIENFFHKVLDCFLLFGEQCPK